MSTPFIYPAKLVYFTLQWLDENEHSAVKLQFLFENSAVSFEFGREVMQRGRLFQYWDDKLVAQVPGSFVVESCWDYAVIRSFALV